MIERLHLTFGRTAFMAVVIGLTLGLSLFLLGSARGSYTVLTMTVGLMLVLPVINVLAILADELRRRDWVFAGVAGAVVLLLAHSVIDRIWQ